MINYTQGDNVAITLTCPGLDLTGASLETRFRSDDADDVVIDNSQHAIDIDQVTNKGKFTVTPTSLQSALFAAGTQLSILTQVTQAGTILTFHGEKIVNVKKATLR